MNVNKLLPTVATSRLEATMLDRSASTFSQRLPKRLRRLRQAAAEVVDLDIETRSELDLRKVGAS